MRLPCWLSATAMALIAGITPVSSEEANLVRNDGFEDGKTSWSQPKTFSIVDDAAHSGTHSLRLVNTNKATYLLASQAIQFKPGMKYRYSAWIKTRGVQGEESGATICMEWSGAKGWLGGSYASGKKGDRDWFHIEDVTAPIPKEATSVRVNLYLRKGMTGTAWFDDVSVTEHYPPALDAALLQPNYRGRLPKNAADPRVIVRVKLADCMKGSLKPEQTTLVCSLLAGDKTVREQRVKRPQAGYNDVTFDAKSLAAGDYRVHVELSAPDGTSLGRQDFELHKLAANAPQPAVFLDKLNRTIVNGKPFFPFGWYFGPGPTTKNFEEHLDRIAASPFNTIMCYGVNAGGVEKVRAYLDAFAARKLKIIYSIKDVFAGTQYYHEPVLGFRGEEAIVRGVVPLFRDHPALLAWYLNDELPLTMRDRLDARHQLVQQLDPNHPTWAVLYQVDEFYGYLNSADVLGADPYPVNERPVTMVSDWTRKCAAVSEGLRPLWMVPQAMNWASYHKDRADKLRAPTLDEELVMTYLCLIHGAHGLIYYCYHDLMRDQLGFDKRWADMLVVGNEVKQLFPPLLSAAKPPKFDVRTSRDTVQFATRADDAGLRYILMANPDPKEAATVSIAVSPRSKLQLLQRGQVKPVTAANGRCEIALEPMSAATLIVK
ncbi:MAG: hypothetical protein HZA88_06335 [Verrucomicrobia bacterium]|nr:hypothetical protein [Verrucomicrobiota bacterium]